MKLEGKVALVTGGARGIGEAMARALHAEGALIVVADLSRAQAEVVVGRIGERAAAMHLDLSDLSSIASVVSKVVELFGAVDILVNNAAIFDMQPFLDISEESYDQLFKINVKGTLFMMQAVARQMITKGKPGKIINIASQAGRRGEALVAAYCASKAAVISLNQSAALALAKYGITVNAISPGVIDTEMLTKVDMQFARYEGLQHGERKHKVEREIPLGRLGTPDDFRGIAVFLASDDSAYITAQTYNVDGGNWMS